MPVVERILDCVAEEVQDRLPFVSLVGMVHRSGKECSKRDK